MDSNIIKIYILYTLPYCNIIGVELRTVDSLSYQKILYLCYNRSNSVGTYYKLYLCTYTNKKRSIVKSVHSSVHSSSEINSYIKGLKINLFSIFYINIFMIFLYPDVVWGFNYIISRDAFVLKTCNKY